MRKNALYRPSAYPLGKKKRVARRKKGSFFFFIKSLILLVVVAALLFGGWKALSAGYQLIVQSKISNWHAKTVSVSGLTGKLGREVYALAKPYEGKPFSIKDAVALREQIIKTYPMLKEVRVKRGLLSGKLKVSAQRRVPLAKFPLPDRSVKYIDADTTIYTDSNPDLLQEVPLVELEGVVPEKVGQEFVELLESTLKLEKQLDFEFLRMNLKENTVSMYMPDGCIIDFGPAVLLKKKALHAAEILDYAKPRYKHPFLINFEFYEDGKVFLTQNAH